MNKKLPFEDALEQQMNDLPLPPEDDSWQKMEKLLDGNDNKKFPPFLLFKRIIFTLVALLILTGTYYFFIQKNRTVTNLKTSTIDANRNGAAAATQGIVNRSADIKNSTGTDRSAVASSSKLLPTTGDTGTESEMTVNKSAKASKDIKQETTNTDIMKKERPVTNKLDRSIDERTKGIRQAGRVNNIKATSTYSKSRTATGETKNVSNIVFKKNGTGNGDYDTRDTEAGKSTASGSLFKETYTEHDQKKLSVLNEANSAVGVRNLKNGEVEAAVPSSKTKDTSAQQSNKNPAVSATVDSLHTPTKGVKNKDSISSLTAACQTRRKSLTHHYFVSIGIAAKQEIPIGGQESNKYNFRGTTSVFADYIPAAYVRLEREKQWYLQGEFYYASPHAVKDFSINRKTGYDTSSNLVVTNSRVTKTYYNSIPLSFNYYVRPQFSIGVGGVYNLFKGAVVEKEVISQNVFTQEKTVALLRTPIKGYTDSFFYKSQTQVLLQAQYSYKRFAFNIRYTKDLEPFVRYTLPNGSVEDKKNWSLDFVLRFRLWKSKNFW